MLRSGNLCSFPLSLSRVWGRDWKGWREDARVSGSLCFTASSQCSAEGGGSGTGTEAWVVSPMAPSCLKSSWGWAWSWAGLPTVRS